MGEDCVCVWGGVYICGKSKGHESERQQKFIFSGVEKKQVIPKLEQKVKKQRYNPLFKVRKYTPKQSAKIVENDCLYRQANWRKKAQGLLSILL